LIFEKGEIIQDFLSRRFASNELKRGNEILAAKQAFERDLAAGAQPRDVLERELAEELVRIEEKYRGSWDRFLQRWREEV
jgi:hypothetical protein